MRRRQRGDWRRRPVDHRILPLVRGLNRPGVVQTIASCQGHVSGNALPYVYFAAPPGAGAALARRVNELRDAGALSYCWSVEGVSVEGVSSPEAKRGFSVYAASADLEGAWSGLWHYVVLRRRLVDADIALLSEELGRVVEDYDVNENPAAGRYAEDRHLTPPPDLVPAGSETASAPAPLPGQGETR